MKPAELPKLIIVNAKLAIVNIKKKAPYKSGVISLANIIPRIVDKQNCMKANEPASRKFFAILDLRKDNNVLP